MKRKKTVANKEKKRRFSLRWLVVCAVGIYAIITVISQQNIISAQLQEKDKLLQRENELKNKVELLTNEKDYIGTDTYVERAAREKLGWVKQGEIIFKKDTGNAAGSGDTQNSN